jgi:hypothetical protein
VKVCVPQAAIAGIDHGGRRYIAKDGILDVPSHVARDLVKHDECFYPANQPRGAEGFICQACGFHGFFRTCGRCGGACERPAIPKEHQHAQER